MNLKRDSVKRRFEGKKEEIKGAFGHKKKKAPAKSKKTSKRGVSGRSMQDAENARNKKSGKANWKK